MSRIDVAKPTLALQSKTFATESKGSNGRLSLLLLGELYFDNSASQANRDGVGPIISAKL